MPENDSVHGVDEALEGEIVEEAGEPAAGGGAAGSGARPGPAASGARTGPAGVTFTVPVDTEAIKQRRDNAAVTFGAVLVVVGAVLLGARFNDVVAAGGPALWIGLGFLTWWAFSGTYGLLVPASMRPAILVSVPGVSGLNTVMTSMRLRNSGASTRLSSLSTSLRTWAVLSARFLPSAVGG